MSLTPFTGTVSAATLNANFDDATTTLVANAKLGQKDQAQDVYVASLVAGTVLSLRTFAWTQRDDAELRVIFAHGTADAGSRTLTLTLTVDNGDTAFLDDETITLTVTSSGAGAFDTRTAGDGDYRTTSGTRVRLLSGVRYRLTIATDAGTWTDAVGVVQLRSVRRTS